MKTSRYTEAQIIRQAEGSVPVAELCHEHGMSNARSPSSMARRAHWLMMHRFAIWLVIRGRC